MENVVECDDWGPLFGKKALELSKHDDIFCGNKQTNRKEKFIQLIHEHEEMFDWMFD